MLFKPSDYPISLQGRLYTREEFVASSYIWH